ncbi:MAG: alpha/beta hydrolase [Boseongicola sp.]|nr:alpha/beta hydrolase [Boseongicola sp.]
MPTFDAPDGTKIHYTDDGHGTPVVALAGLTRNGSDFDYAAPYMASNRLIRMDYRGRGKSGWSGSDTYTIPTEAADVVALLDHLRLENAALLGTSRGGLIAMLLAATAKPRLAGVCLVDIGPELAPKGLETIRDYIGKNPKETTMKDAATMRARLLSGFKNVPETRWQEEVERHYVQTENGLKINYDPALRDAVIAAGTQPVPDLWPFFEALEGLPLALIRGVNSDLLSIDTVHEMQRRRPDMIFTNVPDRGHVPFLDEPASRKVLTTWLTLLP